MIFETEEEKGLGLILTDEREWAFFEHIVIDAEGRGEGWLAKRLGVLMDDEEWDELVAPGLTEQFTEELEFVKREVAAAYQASEEESAKRPAKQEGEDDGEDEEFGEVWITGESSSRWYSVLNQARLALEGKWKLSALKEYENKEDFDGLDDELVSAFLREGYYAHIQSMLLSGLLDL